MRRWWTHLVWSTGVVLATAGGASANWPTLGWTVVTPAEVNLDETALEQARDYALTGGGGGLIVRHGLVAMQWGDTGYLWDVKSSTKSVGSILLGIAIRDGLVNLDDLAQTHWSEIGALPSQNEGTGWLDDITLRHLATHAAGFEKAGGYVVLEHEPDTTWDYSDGGANWLADVLTVRFDDDLDDVLRTRVLTPLGLDGSDVVWRDNLYRTDLLNGHKRREFGAGISISADAMARLGLLMLRDGTWDGTPILPAAFVQEAGTPDPGLAAVGNAVPAEFPGVTSHYGLLWWNNADRTMSGVPSDAYWSWGLGECLIVVIPSLNVVAARVGNGWQAGWSGDYSVLEPFLEPIAQAAGWTAVSAGSGVETNTWARIKGAYRSP